jgi:signal transduction histidine kinase
MKKRIVLVTKDKALVEPFEKSAEKRKLRAEIVATPRESFAKWKAEDGGQLSGVVADMAMMDQQEKIEILQAHCQPGCPPLILLDLPGSPDPRNPAEFVTRLRWPLPAQFLEQLKEISKVPMVFLIDPTLFVTQLMQGRLATIGIPSVPIESHMAISSMLQGGKLGNCAVVQYEGDAFDASVVEQQVRAQIPNVRFFLVSSASSAHDVERALRRQRPAFLPRDLFEHSVEIMTGKAVQDAKGLGRVLFIDNTKSDLIRLVAHLMKEGYEVAACQKFEEALKLAENDSYHVAVIGSALTYAKHNAIDLAQKLRELDPDMRIILMVDQTGAEVALRSVAKGIEVGLDDSLLKPIEEAQLRFSISRALERRRLLIENKRLVEELAESNTELEELSGFQQKFFATVAHDVKNPLTAIRGYAEMLSWKVKEDHLVKCVTHIQSSTRTLEGLISDLVDFAAIENGKLRVNKEEMDLAQVVNEVFERVKVAAEKRQIKFHLECPQGLAKIQGDPLRVSQVVQNLSTNAIQYTAEGGNVFVKVHQSPQVITISVRDTGIGISKEDLPRIFQRFFQTEKAQKMRRAGFGLGLKIAQEIVKGHGGGMGVDSEEGKGSVFYFTMPVPPAVEAPVEAATVDRNFSSAPSYVPGAEQPAGAPAAAPPAAATPAPVQQPTTPPAQPTPPAGPPTQPAVPTGPSTQPPAPGGPPTRPPLGGPPTQPPAPTQPPGTPTPAGRLTPMPGGAPTNPGTTQPITGSPPPPPGIDT